MALPSCPIMGCAHEYSDTLDRRVHETAHCGRNELGLPNWRFIHGFLPSGRHTYCFVPVDPERKDAWGNRLTTTGQVITSEDACISCTACATYVVTCQQERGTL